LGTWGTSPIQFQRDTWGPTQNRSFPGPFRLRRSGAGVLARIERASSYSRFRFSPQKMVAIASEKTSSIKCLGRANKCSPKSVRRSGVGKPYGCSFCTVKVVGGGSKVSFCFCCLLVPFSPDQGNPNCQRCPLRTNNLTVSRLRLGSVRLLLTAFLQHSDGLFAEASST
jgi:hypothetical protein